MSLKLYIYFTAKFYIVIDDTLLRPKRANLLYMNYNTPPFYTITWRWSTQSLISTNKLNFHIFSNITLNALY